MKNTLLKWAVQAARPFIPKHKTTDRILIVTTTALGDTLWATPAIESIRSRFPKAYVGVLTSSIGMEVLKHNPHIDNLFLLQKTLSLWKTLTQEKFDTILLFHASQRLILPLCSLLGATQIIGTAGINKGLDELLTSSLPNQAQHEIVRRLKIAEQIGAKTVTEKLSFFLQPDEILPPRTGGPWIALHPGSKDGFKRWPKENFIELGKRMRETMPCEILITGTKEERGLMEEIGAKIPGAHIDEPGRSLRSFAALLMQMDLLVSNDTGPVHLASALDRPIVGIYSSTDPALCGPHQARCAVAISRRAACNPCLKRKCREPFCFLQIGPEEVLAASNQLVTPC